MNNLYNIEYLVYIAGILVPVNSINIQSAFNSMPMATVSLPAYPQLYGIGREDRLPVQIFIKDVFGEEPPNDYILMFDGEVKSFQYVSNAISREIVINAQSNLAFLMDVKAYFMHSIEDLAERALIPEESNTSFSNFEADYIFPLSLFMHGITANLDESNAIEVPSEFLKNVFTFLKEAESMGKYNNSKLAEFYNKLSERLKILDRMIKVPEFDDPNRWDGVFPVLQGLRSKTALDLLSNRAVNAVDQGKTGDTFYNWLNYLMSEMQYELCFIPSPSWGTNLDGNDALGFTMLKPMFYDAYPPNCNIIFRSHVESIQTQEMVYQVPTRVRVDDMQGIFAQISSGEDTLSRLPRIYHYPTEKYKDSTPPEDVNPFTSDFLPSEEHTGPYVFDTQPPIWASYIDMEDIFENEGIETIEDYWERILSYILQMKVYENRQVQITMAFNPFITAGFPGAVYDTHDEQFTFCGHVVAVNHSLTKNQARTTVTLGFSRLVHEELRDPIKNPFPDVDEITSSLNDMDNIYQSTIASDAIDWNDIPGGFGEENENPTKAYDFNRRQIVTLYEFLDFMGLDLWESMDTGFGEDVPSVLDGVYIYDRRDMRDPQNITPEFSSRYLGLTGTAGDNLEGIRYILKEVAERGFENKIT